MEHAQGVSPLATRSRRELSQRHFATSTAEPMASSVAVAEHCKIASRNLVGLPSMIASRIGTLMLEDNEVGDLVQMDQEFGGKTALAVAWNG